MDATFILSHSEFSGFSELSDLSKPSRFSKLSEFSKIFMCCIFALGDPCEYMILYSVCLFRTKKRITATLLHSGLLYGFIPLNDTFDHCFPNLFSKTSTLLKCNSASQESMHTDGDIQS